LTIGKQIVVPLQPIFGEQKVVPLELGVDESSNQCGLELVMVNFHNSNDEIIPNTNWQF
jgi:hypothetical protein